MIHIVTDSSVHLPQELVERHGIHVVPLKVHFGERSFREGVELTNEEFYHRLQESEEFPITSQPSAGEFLEVYSPLVQGDGEVISIHLSSKLSGTVASANAAKQLLSEGRVTIIDTPWISMGLGWLVLAAAQAVAEGKSHDEVVALVERLIPKIGIIFIVDTLEYLHRGGRIGGAAALVGTLLNVKPLLHLVDGRIEPLARVRSKKAALRRMLELMAERVGPVERPQVAVLHAAAHDEGQALMEKVRSLFPEAETVLAEIGPAVGAHTGPGTLGLAFCVP